MANEPIGNPIKDFQLSGDINKKSDKEYGRQLGNYIWNLATDSNTGYYFLRNATFRKNRLMRAGRMDMSAFVDLLEMNGKTNYVNLSYEPIQLGGTIINKLIGRWMQRDEKIEATAIDPKSMSDKQNAYDVAEFAMEYKPQMQQLEQASGIPSFSPDQFIPEDRDELALWMSELNRLPEEIVFEIGVNNVFDKNGWQDTLKRMLLDDGATCGLVGTKAYAGRDGIVIVENLVPENIIYSYSNYNDMRDTSWRGYVRSMKISEIRFKYQKTQDNPDGLTEEELFDIAQRSKMFNPVNKLTWISQWSYAYNRPYDDWNVDVIEWEIKTTDVDTYEEKITKANSTIINKNPKKLQEGTKVTNKTKINIYAGVYTVGQTKDGYVLEWGVKKNMIRPQDPKELGDAEFSYSFYMYNNYEMRNKAIPERIRVPLEQMILSRLKMQQLVAKMRPAGMAINVDALQEIDLGQGETNPLEIQKIYDQTGSYYYSGRDAEGNPIQHPFDELTNAGSVAQLNELVNIYNFNLGVIKDEIGEDPNLIDKAIQPRVTQGNVQTAQQQSEFATDYIYDAYLAVMEDTAAKVACLLSDSIQYGGKAYRDLMGEEEVKDRNFSMKIKMKSSDQEIQLLDAMLNNVITAQPTLLLYCDPFKIKRIAKDVNVKLAEQYFYQCQKKAIKGERENSAQQQAQNGQIQVQSAQAKAQSDMQLKEMQSKMEIAKQQMSDKGQQKNTLLSGIMDMYKTGIPLPPALQAYEQQLVQNLIVPIIAENQAMQQMIQQGHDEAEQQDQEQQQGVPPQEEGQDQQDMMQQEQGGMEQQQMQPQMM